VAIPLGMQHYVMLSRNLLYTGGTRGKQVVVLDTDMDAFYASVEQGQRHNDLVSTQPPPKRSSDWMIGL
jgi:ATP-dependent exoDNAse (exonuclease V) alpha subunit